MIRTVNTLPRLLARTVLALVSLFVVLAVVVAGWCVYLGRQTYDVIAVLGQSNAAGYGAGWSVSDAVPHPGVAEMVTEGVLDGTVIPAVDRPGTPTRPEGQVGFDRQFAIDYHEHTGRDALVVNTAVGATGFTPTAGATWNPADSTAPTNLYRNAVAEIRAALEKNAGSRLVAVLWHQGENDVNKLDATQYRDALGRVISGVRDEFGVTPFLVGQMVPEWITDKGEPARQIDSVHRTIPGQFADAAYVAGPVGLRNADGIHYSAQGQRVLGEKFWSAYATLTTTG